VIQTHADPVNESIMEQLVMIDALKRASAKRITAVVPYYGYSRQDKKALAREPISGRLIADCLTAAGADRVVSVDLHSGQIQGFFDYPFDHLTALPLLAGYLQDDIGLKNGDLAVVAPDAGRVKVAERLREQLHADLAFIYKRRSRREAHKIERMTVVGAVAGKPCILIDDIIDTGGTTKAAVGAVLEAGCEPQVTAVASHGLFVGSAEEDLSDTPVERFIVTDSVPPPEGLGLPLEVVSLAPLLASAIDRLHNDRSLDELLEHI
jgi:ribose-phosphate pyrophosphokinase